MVGRRGEMCRAGIQRIKKDRDKYMLWINRQKASTKARRTDRALIDIESLKESKIGRQTIP